MNHLENEDEVRAFFERVSLFAYPDGMFIFDVNTPYKHREILANNAFIYDMEGLYCGWQNEYDKTDSSVSIYLDFFEKTEKGYERYSESFREIAVEIPRVEELLSQTGFEILGVYDGYSEAPLAENSERAVFVCRKICEDN